jgi:predicted nucleic acid-binding protein
MSVEPARFVLDSFALLAFLEGEVGMARVKAVLKDAEKGRCQVYLSWINLGEVLYITEREQGQRLVRETLAHIQSLPIQMLEVTPRAVLEAAHIKATHRLSYADAFAVVAALDKGATALTGDPEFKSVETIIQIEWLAQEP